MRYFLAFFLLCVVAVVSILGLPGSKSSRPPLYIFPDMDWQAKYLPQRSNTFFKNAMNDRPSLSHAISRGQGWERDQVFSSTYTYLPSLHPALYTGKDTTGAFSQGFPFTIDEAILLEGQKKYTLFCQVCHGASGDGNGITKQYGMIATASYHDDRIRQMPEGEIFNTITHGKNTMNGYGDKLSPEERWAIIAYVRALQRSQNASVSDVPSDKLHLLGL